MGEESKKWNIGAEDEDGANDAARDAADGEETSEDEEGEDNKGTDGGQGDEDKEVMDLD